MFEALKRNLGLSPLVRNVERPAPQSVRKSEQVDQSVPKDEFVCDADAQICSDYRTLMTGVCVESQNQEHFVNGVNVDKLLALFKLRPTKPAEKYLRDSVLANVHLRLGEQNASVKNHDRLLAVSQKIQTALKENSRRSDLRLLAGRDSAVS